MKHSSTRELFEYWDSRRGRLAAPERCDIEPGPIRRVLGDTFILGLDERAGHPFRLAGTRLCALFCRELKNESFLGLWTQLARPGVRERIAGVAAETIGMVASVTGRTPEGASLDLELLLLPLGIGRTRVGACSACLHPMTFPIGSGRCRWKSSRWAPSVTSNLRSPPCRGSRLLPTAAGCDAASWSTTAAVRNRT